MSNAVQLKVNELFEKTKNLMSLEEIKPFCEEFNEWMHTNTNYSEKSLGTILSRCGFYKKFNGIPLEQDKNAESVPKYHKDDRNNIIGYELKHYAVLLCGLSKEDWENRNNTTRVIERLEHDHEIDPDKYLEVTTTLLKSNDIHEIAVGLIASTGRRPHEIIARADFNAIEGQNYVVMFEGQGKKREEKPIFPIATLHPAEYIINALNNFRLVPENQQLIKDVINESDELSEQNRKLDSRRNQSLNRVVRKYFKDILPVREGEEENNCKALRAAYGALATERDCKGSIGTKMLYFARLLGHFTDTKPTDDDLKHILSTLGYSDYYVNKPVPYVELKIEEPELKPEEPELKTEMVENPILNKKSKELVYQWRGYEKDIYRLKQIQKKQNLNQQDSLRYLVDMAESSEIMKNRIIELESQLAQLRQEKENLEMSTPKQEMTNSDLEAFIKKEVELQVHQEVKQALYKVARENQIKALESVREKREKIDWQSKSNSEIWAAKVNSATIEKIRRCFLAICEYNDNPKRNQDERLAITNLALRELSGANGLLVSDWIKSHADEIISHNSKYGMQNTKDPTKTETYYNKHHGKDKISSILQLIKETIFSNEVESED